MYQPNPIPAGVRERKLTTWHNPNPFPQTVIVRAEEPFAFIVGPGETKELDSRYDHAIQMIDCGKDECHRRGWFCRAGHDGHVVGGGAPLLKRVGKSDSLDDSLDPSAQQRRDVEAQIDREVEREKVLEAARVRRDRELDVATAPKQAASAQGQTHPKKG